MPLNGDVQSDVTVVMYHFVLPPSPGVFGRLKGLTLSAFREQLAYIVRHYTPISVTDLVRALDRQGSLPSRPIVLTFDDGYRCHYRDALPLIEAAKVPALFFPVASASLDRHVLDVNKIQCVLANTGNADALVDRIEAAVSEAPGEMACPTVEQLRQQWWKPSRWDPAPVTYVKRLLQHALPEALRRRLVDDLFASEVSRDEAAFADDLYMNAGELRDLASRGMTVGAHGDRHVRLTTLAPAEQAREIQGALRVIDAAAGRRDGFAYCYANGDYDPNSIELLRTFGCTVAFTTKPDLIHPDRTDRFALPRLDTNDLPARADAEANEWTRRAMAISRS